MDMYLLDGFMVSLGSPFGIVVLVIFLILGALNQYLADIVYLLYSIDVFLQLFRIVLKQNAKYDLRPRHSASSGEKHGRL